MNFYFTKKSTGDDCEFLLTKYDRDDEEHGLAVFINRGYVQKMVEMTREEAFPDEESEFIKGFRKDKDFDFYSWYDLWESYDEWLEELEEKSDESDDEESDESDDENDN